MITAASEGGATGSAWYNFLEEPINPRAMAMGSAGTALGCGGASFYNPAALSLRKAPYIAFEFGKLYEDLGRGYLETGWLFPGWFTGLSFQSQSVQFQYATEQGKVDSYGLQQSTAGSLTGGFRKNNFALGVGINGIYDRLAESSSWGFSLSGGAVYSLIPGMLDIGAAYMHGYGRGTGYLDTTNALSRNQLPASARIGTAFQHSINGNFPFVISADFVYNTNYEKLTVPLGVEMRVLPALAIRLGKQFNHPADLFSAGVGLQWENLKFDASFVPFRLISETNVKWSIGLTYELASVAENKGKKAASAELKTPAVPVIESEPAKPTDEQIQAQEKPDSIPSGDTGAPEPEKGEEQSESLAPDSGNSAPEGPINESPEESKEPEENRDGEQSGGEEGLKEEGAGGEAGFNQSPESGL